MTGIFGGEVPEKIVIQVRAKKPQPLQKENTGADRLWKAVRVLRRFNQTDLVVTTGETPSNVWSFLRRYIVAGYLQKATRPNRRAGGEAVYALIKDPGPKRPPYKTLNLEETSDRKELD